MRAEVKVDLDGVNTSDALLFRFRSDKKIGCNVLNRMAELGKPESQAIVGE